MCAQLLKLTQIIFSKRKHTLTFFFISSCSFLLRVLFATAILPILKDFSLLSSSACRCKQSTVSFQQVFHGHGT